MNPSRILLAGLLLATTSVLEAQSLTRAQAGRVAVAQCYAHCLELSYNQTMQSARFVLDALAGEWTAQNVLSTTCTLVQTNAQMGDMCVAGCMDIEASYRVRLSHIRTRFHRILNESLRDLRTSGLWSAWNRYPEVGTAAFDRACVRYAQIVSARSAQTAQAMKETKPLDETA